MKTALITGISGQDGSFLAELLLQKGYQVHGLVMEKDLSEPRQRLNWIAPFLDRLTLHSTALIDEDRINQIFRQVQPDECYHLAAQSYVSYSVEDELSTVQTNINGSHYILAAILRYAPHCKFFFAASAEMFGNVTVSPQDEQTPFRPRSVYGVTKVTGFFLTQTCRDHHNLFACNGIFYNHESERRGMQFVTRKITSGAARIKLGMQSSLRLGNLDACRDWGYAPEYVEAMWRMLQQETADDYVIGTGETHSVKEFLEAAFGVLDLDWQQYVVVDPQFYRPAETVELRANPAKARARLGWQAQTPFAEIVRRMVLYDLEQLQQQAV